MPSFPIIFYARLVSLWPPLPLILNTHTRLIKGILPKAREEEQMSLWTEIRIITLTALQTAMWRGAWKTNDRMLTCVDHNCNFCTCVTHAADFYSEVVIFSKLSISRDGDTLHAVGSTSLGEISTRGRGNRIVRGRQKLNGVERQGRNSLAH